jgi:hypothetical protein
MLKTSFIAGIVSALAISCASSHGQPREIAASAGCRSLGDASQTVAAVLSPEVVYGAERVDVDRRISVTGTQPGSLLYLRATSGMSQEYLERVLSCHAAYGRAISASDPFHPQSGGVAQVQVASSGPGYSVRVVGEDARTDREIWRRARELAYSTVQAEQLASTATRASTQ